MGEGGNYQEEDVTQDGGENVRGKWIWSGKERRKNREGQTGRVASWGGSQEREDEVGGGGGGASHRKLEKRDSLGIPSSSGQTTATTFMSIKTKNK